ncbi:MAG: ribulose-phosphate 3-epimerase [Planctomycetota bacterium]
MPDVFDPYAHDRPMILPSILSADFTKLGSEIDDVLSGGGDALHVDIMDGHFVRTVSFGPVVVKAARQAAPEAYLDCHLMVTRPEEVAPQLIAAGADGITFHAELADNVRRTLAALKTSVESDGVDIGVAINPMTPAEAVFPILDEVRLVLVMSVVPGASGQSFMPSVLDKCEAIKQRLRPDQRLEIDGGISVETIGRARSAGVDWFVAASAIFEQPSRSEAIAALRAGLS